MLKNRLPPHFTWKPAAIIPVKATTDPTDKSMPPRRITKVIPTAITPIIETWRITFKMLRGLKKTGVRIPNKMHTTIKANKIPILSHKMKNRSTRLTFLSSFQGVGHKSFSQRLNNSQFASSLLLSSYLPSLITKIRSLIAKISGSSETIIMAALHLLNDSSIGKFLP